MRPLHYSPVLAVLAFLVALGCQILAPGAAYADDGGTYARLPREISVSERACGTYENVADAGKSTVSFEAWATDGCHDYHWTNVQGQDGKSGSVTFTVNSKATYVWDEGSTIPQPNGPGGWCAYQAADEAHKYFVYHAQVPDGTSVTVRFTCT